MAIKNDKGTLAHEDENKENEPNDHDTVYVSEKVV